MGHRTLLIDSEQLSGLIEPSAEIDFVSLPIASVWHGERRLEAETYLTGGHGLRVIIEGSLPFRRLSELADVWQPPRLKGTLVGPTSGLPFFTATQVFDIRPVVRKWVAPSKTPHLERRMMEPGWILVTCSGSVGDTIVSYEPHLQAVVSHDLLRVQARSPDDTGRLYAFLRSKYGRTILRSSKYGSIVKHLEPEHLFDVPVPDISDELSTSIRQRIGNVFSLREKAFRLTREAEDLYSRQFPPPVPSFRTDAFSVGVVEAFKGRRRLEAFHYNPQAQAVWRALEASGYPIVQLSDVSERVFGVPRFKHVYRDLGIPYVDSEDLFKINPELDKYIPEVTKRDADRYYVERQWLLMASSGQIYGLNGSVVLANSWHERKIVSNHVVRIVPSGVRPGYLAVVLGHLEYGRPLVLRLAFGSEIPEISPEDLKTLPVPRIGDELENAIADRMEEASSLRQQADAEEDKTVADLESQLDGELRE